MDDHISLLSPEDPVETHTSKFFLRILPIELEVLLFFSYEYRFVGSAVKRVFLT